MRIILLVFSLIYFLDANCQAKAWDSTFRPGSWNLKVQQFRDYPDSKKDIIFLGNSITAGVDWNELLQNTNVRNRGISGDITFGLLERLDEREAEMDGVLNNLTEKEASILSDLLDKLRNS